MHKLKEYLRHLVAFFQKKALKIEKRLRFVFSAVFLTIMMLISTFFPFDYSIFFIALFIILAFILTYFSLLEGVEKIELFTLFFMPIILTVSFYLVYFLFPIRWITRLPFVLIYGISIYAVLLCSNIFNVGVEKSLQLYRAAFSINYFYQMVVIFFLLNTLFSFKLNFFLNALAIAIIAFLFGIQLVWTVKLNLYLDRNIKFLGLFIAIVLSEIAIIGSFVPLKASVFALLLTSSYYSLAGLVYNFVDQRLFKETVREFVVVWLIVLAITLLSISW